jgi:hypothetical protein
VESPLKRDITNRSGSSSATMANEQSGKTLQNGSAAGNVVQDASKSTGDAMDIDHPLSNHPVTQEPNSSRLKPPDPNGMDENSLSNEPDIDLDPIEAEAVVDFIQ